MLIDMRKRKEYNNKNMGLTKRQTDSQVNDYYS